MSVLTAEHIWSALNTVMDPEIPVVSLVEMGIVRQVAIEGETVTVTMTPTFSGCPALVEMERLIIDQVHSLGATSVSVKKALSPAWSSDWINEEGRRKLREFGLAPPPRHGGNLVVTFFDIIACPYCGSTNTTLKNSFGSTLCRAIYYCHACQDSFEQFKAL